MDTFAFILIQLLNGVQYGLLLFLLSSVGVSQPAILFVIGVCQDTLGKFVNRFRTRIDMDPLFVNHRCALSAPKRRAREQITNECFGLESGGGGFG